MLVLLVKLNSWTEIIVRFFVWNKKNVISYYEQQQQHNEKIRHEGQGRSVRGGMWGGGGMLHSPSFWFCYTPQILLHPPDIGRQWYEASVKSMRLKCHVFVGKTWVLHPPQLRLSRYAPDEGRCTLFPLLHKSTEKEFISSIQSLLWMQFSNIVLWNVINWGFLLLTLLSGMLLFEDMFLFEDSMFPLNNLPYCL